MPQQSQVPETNGEVWSKKDLPLVKKDLSREYLSKSGLHKTMGPDDMYPREMRKLADIIVRPLFVISERLWQLEGILKDCKKKSITANFKRSKKDSAGNYWSVSSQSLGM